MQRAGIQNEQKLARLMLQLMNHPKIRVGSGGNALEISYQGKEKLLLKRPSATRSGIGSLNGFR